MNSWLVWCPERDEGRDDAGEFDAESAEKAAELWAEDTDDRGGDDVIVGGEIVEVLVAPADESAEPVLLLVSGEMMPQYTARPVKERDGG